MAIVGRMSTKKVISMHSINTRYPSLLTIVFLNGVLEQPWGKMSPGIHGDNLLAVSPLRKGTNVGGRLGVGKVGSVGSSVSNVIFSLRQWTNR
jgi:hypothetical protein